MTKKKLFYKSILIGIFFSLGVPQFGWWFFLFGAFFFQFQIVDQIKCWKSLFFSSFLISVVYNFVTHFWIIEALKNFWSIHTFKSISIFFLYLPFGSLNFLIFPILLKFILKNNKILNPVLISFLTASAYMLVDFTVPKVFMESIGHDFYNFPLVRSLAFISGVSFITFLVVFVSALFYKMFSNFKIISILFIVIIFILTLGYFLDKNQSLYKEAETLHVGVIQANTPLYKKIESKNNLDIPMIILNEYLKLTDLMLRSSPSLDLLVWPETAFLGSFLNPRNSTEEQLKNKFLEFMKPKNIPIVFGGLDYKNNENKIYNSMYLFYKNETQVYHKKLLFPLGEYVPFPWFFSLFGVKNIENKDFNSGGKVQLLEIFNQFKKSFKIIPSICYEILDASLIQKAAQLENDFIVNITNDSWFGRYAEPYQHLHLSVFRSIETGKPLLRAAHSGVTALILPSGKIIGRTDIFAKAYQVYLVPIYKNNKTLYTKWGDWFYFLNLFFMISYFIFNSIQSYLMRPMRK